MYLAVELIVSETTNNNECLWSLKWNESNECSSGPREMCEESRKKERVKTFTGTEFVCATLGADNFSLIREKKPIETNWCQLKTTNTQFAEEFFNFIKQRRKLRVWEGCWIKI